jgi:hypothetical protein
MLKPDALAKNACRCGHRGEWDRYLLFGARALASDGGGCAMFPATSYDPETLAMLSSAFEEAWNDVQAMIGPRPLDPNGLRSHLAKRVMAAAATGERDPRRLKLIAIGAIEA